MSKFCKDPTYVKLIQSTRWRKVRNQYLQDHPTCERCGMYLATEIHHITPLTRFKNEPEKMERMAFDEDNLQALCHDCHIKAHIELGKYIHNIKNSEAYHKEQAEQMIQNLFR